MREKIEPVMHIIDIAQGHEAGRRGGTDGAQLSFKGLPCPNIFAGGLNFHGRYEFVPIESMEKAVLQLASIQWAIRSLLPVSVEKWTETQQ